MTRMQGRRDHVVVRQMRPLDEWDLYP
jgi:hypothetical protein